MSILSRPYYNIQIPGSEFLMEFLKFLINNLNYHMLFIFLRIEYLPPTIQGVNIEIH